MWYMFESYNSERLFGYGTRKVADAALAHLNHGRDINLYSMYPLTDAYGPIADNTFAAACIDNGVLALIEALRNGADEYDCQTWGITPEEWQQQIELALGALLERRDDAIFTDDSRVEDFMIEDSWETRQDPLAVCLKEWHGRDGWSRDRAAAELRVPRSTYDGWCSGRGMVPHEGLIRRAMDLIDGLELE